MQFSEAERRIQSQRIQVTCECEHACEQRIKICLENHNESLGWYIAASLSIPLDQLPLLQQAIDDMRSGARLSQPKKSNIIPFPGSVA